MLFYLYECIFYCSFSNRIASNGTCQILMSQCSMRLAYNGEEVNTNFVKGSFTNWIVRLDIYTRNLWVVKYPIINKSKNNLGTRGNKNIDHLKSLQTLLGWCYEEWYMYSKWYWENANESKVWKIFRAP